MKSAAALLLLVALPLFGSERERLKNEVIERPGDANSRYLLARTFEKEGFRAPALLEYLRFLALESDTPRAKDAAKHLVTLLNRGVKRKSGNETSIALDMNPPVEEGDFQGWELFLGLAAATTDRKLPEFERVWSHLSTGLSLLVESRSKAETYTHLRNVPFFAELEQKELLDTFAGFVLLPLDLKGEKAWVAEHEAAIRELVAYLRELPR